MTLSLKAFRESSIQQYTMGLDEHVAKYDNQLREEEGNLVLCVITYKR